MQADCLPGHSCTISFRALQNLPRVDVGSLEEVIGRMEQDDKGDWGDVVFVPPRSVAAAGELQAK